jgi:hypothetical protein
MRALPVPEWPEADRRAWEAACRPGMRLKRGGRASHLKPITRDDLERRYGYFLHHLALSGELDRSAAAGTQVTPVAPPVCETPDWSYAAMAAGESWFWRTAAGVWSPCRSISQVVL